MGVTRSRKRAALRFLIKSALLLFLLSAGPVVLFRYVHPPVSALMIQRRIESLSGPAARGAEESYKPRYDWVPLDEIAPVMGVAVIAAEDQKFAEHFGFDWAAIEKAIAHNETSKRVRGASTLSQQTAKNLFLWSGQNWIRKGLEAYFTLLMEASWPKRRILETYLNIVEFGDGLFGVEAASQHYFGKPASRLSAAEAALLAAVLPNPHRFKVKAPTPYVVERQQWILGQIRQLGGAARIKDLQ